MAGNFRHGVKLGNKNELPTPYGFLNGIFLLFIFNAAFLKIGFLIKFICHDKLNGLEMNVLRRKFEIYLDNFR